MRRLSSAPRIVSRLAPVLVAVLVAVGCGGQQPIPSIPVGSTSDPESELVAHLYAAALRFYGNPAHVSLESDPFGQLDSGEIRVAPGFTGRLLQRFEPDAPARSAAQVYRALASALPEGIAVGDYTTSAQDKPAIAVTDETAEEWATSDVAAIVRRCGEVSIGVVTAALHPSAVGGCALPKPREFADTAALFASLQSAQIDAAWTTTAAPDLPSEVVVLSDKTALIRAENLVALYRRNELTESQVLALNEIAGVLDTGALADMRRQVDEGADPGAVAGQWLETHPIGVGS